MRKFLFSIDQGTTSSRVLIINEQGQIQQIFQKDFNQLYDGAKVLQDASVVYDTVRWCLDEAFKYAINDEVLAIGITNQRETTVLFDQTGIPLDYAISWQSKHTEEICESWRQLGFEPYIKKSTGLVINPYFSASKIRYLLDKHKNEDLTNCYFGTMDTYILYRLTNGKSFKTDVSNASRTMLYNIHQMRYDQKILDLTGIPKHMLPEVCPSNSLFGYYNGVPITGILGDQQSALFGHLALNPGEMKVTYGTGCFILMNTGNKVHMSKKGLISTVAWQIDDEVTYALEGSIFVAGSSVKWLRDQLQVIKTAEESEKLAMDATHDLYFVPAFVGLGAPYWDTDVRGTMFGITADIDKKDIVRATLNAVGYQVKDVVDVMISDTEIPLETVGIDGGLSNNNYLMQFQSDLLRCPLKRIATPEVTGLGVAYLAGLKTGFFPSLEIIAKQAVIKELFIPKMSLKNAKRLYQGWQKAVSISQLYK